MNRKEWLIIAIITLISIVTWVVSDIIHSRSRVEIPQKIQELIEPIDPNFNTQDI